MSHSLERLITVVLVLDFTQVEWSGSQSQNPVLRPSEMNLSFLHRPALSTQGGTYGR